MWVVSFDLALQERDSILKLVYPLQMSPNSRYGHCNSSCDWFEHWDGGDGTSPDLYFVLL